MRRSVAVVLGAVAMLATTQSAQAQTYKSFVYAGGGVTFPTGDYGTYAKSGWLAEGGFGYNLNKNAFFTLEGMFGANKHDDGTGDKTELVGGTVGLGYSFGAEGAKVMPYVIGGVGMLNHKWKPATGASESDTKAMVYGGAGLYFPMGSSGFFVEGRYVARKGTTFIPLMAGFQLNFGKK